MSKPSSRRQRESPSPKERLTDLFMWYLHGTELGNQFGPEGRTNLWPLQNLAILIHWQLCSDNGQAGSNSNLRFADDTGVSPFSKHYGVVAVRGYPCATACSVTAAMNEPLASAYACCEAKSPASYLEERRRLRLSYSRATSG